jgi:hypothetical protein
MIHKGGDVVNTFLLKNVLEGPDFQIPSSHPESDAAAGS